MYFRMWIALAVLVLWGLGGFCPGAGPGSTLNPKETMAAGTNVKIMTLDPGHYHAALVQKNMYAQVDPIVHVYAPAGADLDAHLAKIDVFNTRPEQPTAWDERVYTGPDFFDRMLRDAPGNLVVLAGNNTRKTQYILGCVKAGFNVLADKPMAITPAQYDLLLESFRVAEQKNVLLYDIMTERYEITTILQRELSMVPEVFGELQAGTVERPAVTKESIHHFSKLVAGKPLIRPAWFFDVNQEGEGIVDVATHLVDLVQWECFPEQILSTGDVRILSARRWSTAITLEQFKKVTGVDQFPGFLQKDVKDGVLQVFGNGEMVYTLRGKTAKVSVTWNFEAPAGGNDTHYSIMRGSKADLIIRQGKDQAFKPTLYVENKSGASDHAFGAMLTSAVERISARWPGVTCRKTTDAWEIEVPDALRSDHEQHFCEVTSKFLGYLAQGRLPAWEVPNMIVKYHTIMEAYKASR